MSKLNIDQKSVRALFSEKKADFLIPDYQRPYAWGEKECQTLWDDLFLFAFPDNDCDKFNSDSDEYFLGPIVTFKNDDGKMEIIDGQQRLTTLMLLLRAFYEKYGSMLDDENDFDEDDVSTPLYRWDYLCLSNIGSSIGILKYIKVNEDIYSFDENSAIRPDECYQIHGSRLTNFTSGHVNSIHLGLYDKCFNFYEYNISFSIKELAPRDHPRENEKLLHFDTIDCVHNLYRPKQSFIGSFFHYRF